VNQLKMFAGIVREGSWMEAVIDTADPNRQPMPKPDLRRMLKERGPVVVFGASNFPFAFGAVGGDTASALAAGNPVVVKGHPSHPGTSGLFAKAVDAAIEECKLPKGLFTLLQGRAHELSAQLVKHPLTMAVGFTGSLRAGRALFDMAAARANPIPVYAEMGSVNPIVILPGAAAQRGETIAQQLAGSVLLGGGQFCTKPGLIFTIGKDDSFVQALAKHIQSAAAATMLNRSLRENFCSRIDHFAKTPGVKSVVSGAASGNASMSPCCWKQAHRTGESRRRCMRRRLAGRTDRALPEYRGGD
jgi:NADP-dependent aldehyde dehydrogenase